MSNIRILYNNITNDASSLAASATAGSLVAGNLKNDIKTSVHRSTGTSLTYTLQWETARALSLAALVFSNLSATATMRARVYAEIADPSPAVDSGVKLACAYAPLGQFRWGSTPLGVNAFRYGGGSYGRVYFTATMGKKLVLDINDANNPSGYIEGARLVTGAYWEAESNPEWGAELRVEYNAQHEVSAAGDLRTERRAKRRGLGLEMGWIKSQADQLAMYEIMMVNGMEGPLFVSLFPESDDPLLEQRHQLYCKIEGDMSMSHPRYGIFAAPLNLREV